VDGPGTVPLRMNLQIVDKESGNNHGPFTESARSAPRLAGDAELDSAPAEVAAHPHVAALVAGYTISDLSAPALGSVTLSLYQIL